MHLQDIRDLLRAEHEYALELAGDMCEAETAKEGRELLKKLKPAWTAHSRAEEAVVYRALLTVARSAKAQEMGDEGIVEHALVDALLDKLARSRKLGPEGWAAQSKVLKELLEHHIEVEHGAMFDELEQHFQPAELEAMGTHFLREKQKHFGARVEETA